MYWTIGNQDNKVIEISVDVDVVIDGKKLNIIGYYNYITGELDLNVNNTRTLKEVFLEDYCKKNNLNYDDVSDFIRENLDTTNVC